METAFHKQINYANAYGNEGGYLLWSRESVCGGEADENARVTFFAVNQQELAPTTLSRNICFVFTSLRLHTPASHLLLDL